MLKHWWTSTWRLLKSDRSFSLITILSLAIGWGASVLVGAYLHEEFSYERWLPGHEDVARIEMRVEPPGEEPYAVVQTFGGLRALFDREGPGDRPPDAASTTCGTR